MTDYLDPTKEIFAKFREMDRPGPIHMLNLVKFREDPDAMLVMSLEDYDEATGKAVEKFTEGHTDMPLPAGTYTVMFGKAAWKGIALKKGEAFELKPGRLKIEKEGSFYYMLRDAAGNDVLKLTSGTNDIPFPPGKYTLDVEGQQVPVTISEGKRMVLKIR